MTLKVLLIVLLIALIVAGVYSVRNQLWVQKHLVVIMWSS